MGETRDGAAADSIGAAPRLYMCANNNNDLLFVSEKSNVFLKDPTDVMTNMYGDTIVTTNGKNTLTHTNAITTYPLIPYHLTVLLRCPFAPWKFE